MKKVLVTGASGFIDESAVDIKPEYDGFIANPYTYDDATVNAMASIDTFTDGAILVAIGFIRRDADVGEALVSDADLLLAEVVAQCFDATEVVVFCTEFEVNNGAFLFVCCHS